MYIWEIRQWNHQDSNNRFRKNETLIKPLDDASSICETWYNWIFLEFLMIILTNFCDGTTFHNLWDHKILFKRDDWILHVSEVRFGNRSRIRNKLFIYTQSIRFLTCQYWTPMVQVAEMLFEKREVCGSNLVWDMNFWHICWMLKVMRFENWLNFQNTCAIIV